MISLIESVEPGDGVGILLAKLLNSMSKLLTLHTLSLAVDLPRPSAIVKGGTEHCVCSTRCDKQVSGTLEGQEPSGRPEIICMEEDVLLVWACPSSVATTPVIGTSV